jgi:hypothetical protein
MKTKFISKNLTKRRIRQLERQIQAHNEILDRWKNERTLLAKLSAETPQFSNPLHVYEAKQIRDEILKRKT